MNLNASCISCIVGREEKRIRPLKDEAMKKDYMIRVLHILAEDNGEPAPAKSIHLKKLQEEMLGAQPSWRETNRSYNLMMLKTEKDLQEKIAAAKDPLAAAMLYARAGNYIDFGAMQDVSKEKLEELLDRALSETLDSQTYEDFLQDLKKAKSLVYLTDNCGEIVADKLLISQLLHQFPELQITVVVRGEEAVNDATLIDAREVGLTELVPVIGNVHAAPLDAAGARDELVAHLVSPVQFEASVAKLQEAGAKMFAEVGFGGVLANLVKRIDRSAPRAAIQDRPSFDAFVEEFGKE